MRLETPDEPSSAPAKCKRRMSLLREFMRSGDVGAELGVFKGSFLDHLLATKPSRLYAVDPWYRAGAAWKWASADQSTRKAFITILQTFSEEIDAGILIPRVEFSHEFLKSIPDKSLDWVYIDTTHTYEQTLMEIELSITKVKPGGHIMGDDYVSDPDHPHYGVWKAVQMYSQSKHLDIVLDGEGRQFVGKVKM